MNWQSITVLSICAIVLGSGAIDLGLFAGGGNPATISRTMLGKAASRPLIVILLAYTWNLLQGHLFEPRIIASPSGAELVGVLILGLSPIVAGLVLIASAPDESDSALLQWAHHPGWTALLVAIGSIWGWVNGRFVLPQHLG